MASPDRPANTLDHQSDLVATPRKLVNVRKTRTRSRLARLSTSIRSLYVLRTLTKTQVDNFMNSYVIYDLDWKDEKMMIETLGPEYQDRVGECLRDYYSVLNHMCALGKLEKMYIPPVMDLDSNIFTNQILYEESIAGELQLPNNAKILDLGCGRGRVAAHMSALTGAKVTGINIDSDQVASAITFNKEQGLSNSFIRMDFNDLPLPHPDAHFDGFYQIQAFSLCKDIPKLCQELFRVLKPGARLSLLDWVSLEAFNPDDAHHKALMRQIKPLIGAVGTPTPQSLAEDLKSAGFDILRMNNSSINGLQSPLIEQAEHFFRVAEHAILGLVRVGLLPAHFKTLFDRFRKDGEAFIEADKARLITTSYHWLAIKPTISAPLCVTSTAQATTNVYAGSGEHPEMITTSDMPADLDFASRSAATSRHTMQSSVGSEDQDKSPSPASSGSTGITEPSLEPDDAAKV